LTFAVVLPFLGRLILDFGFGKAKDKLKNTCGCADKTKENTKEFLKAINSGEDPEQNWKTARKECEDAELEVRQCEERKKGADKHLEEAEQARAASNTTGGKMVNKASGGKIGTQKEDRARAKQAKESKIRTEEKLETARKLYKKTNQAEADARKVLDAHNHRQKKINEADAKLNAPGYTMRELCGELGDKSFEDAMKANGYQGQAGLAYCIAGARLAFWHWLQPVLYFVVFACETDDIDDLQKWLGKAVWVREFLYLFETIMCVFVNPDFLMIDVMACKNDPGNQSRRLAPSFQEHLSGKLMTGWGFVMMYVLSPEKFVVWATFDKGGVGGEKGLLRNFLLFVGVILDFAGIAALIVGFQSNSMPMALAVGYGATAVGGVCFVILVFQVMVTRYMVNPAQWVVNLLCCNLLKENDHPDNVKVNPSAADTFEQET
jgi:hypothetical protein